MIIITYSGEWACGAYGPFDSISAAKATAESFLAARFAVNEFEPSVPMWWEESAAGHCCCIEENEQQLAIVQVLDHPRSMVA